jgi:RNA polymerase sigma factor (sigma-70 family)
MLTAGWNGLVDHLRRGLAADPRADAAVVRQYAATGDAAAFAELVRRFAPLVWGVCRRTVPDRHLAEDAFQATFLVLVRKAGAVRPPSAVGGWLHAVAVHTSTRARAMLDRRRKRVQPLATGHEPAAAPPPDPPDPAALRALDEEVARLPDGLRAAVALCELGGVSRREAAERLGIAEGTLSSRLAAARKRLAARLRSRGIALAAALAVLTAETSAAPAVSATPTSAASTLADGVVRTMFLSKLRLTVAVVALLAGVAGSVAVAAPPAPDRERYRIKAPVPKAAEKEGKLLFWLDEKPLLLAPDGTELPSPDAIPKVHFSGSADARLSPDGKRVAFQYRDNDHRGTLRIFDLGEKTPQMTVLDAVTLNDFHWLGDGKTLYVRGSEGKGGKLDHWVYDPAADNRTPLKVPKDFFIRAVSPDGKVAVADEWKMTATEWHQHAHLWALDGTEKPTPLLELNQSISQPRPVFSPDGKHLLCKLKHYGTHKPLGNGGFDTLDFKCNDLVVIDLATKKKAVLKELGENPEWRVCGLAWSPDGKRVAYVEYKPVSSPPGRPLEEPYRVTVADADGKNAKEIHAANGAWLVGFDWR